MKMPLVAVLLPLAACGRTGFDVVPDAGLARIACGTAPTVLLADATNANKVKSLAATSTPEGFAIFTTDDVQNVNGLVVSLSASDPTPVITTTSPKIASGVVGQVGAFTAKSGLVLAVPTGAGAQANGTTIVTLSDLLTPSGEHAADGWLAQTGSVAFNTAGVGAYLVQDKSSKAYEGSLDASLIDHVPLVASSPAPAMATIIAADAKFALTWADDSGATNLQLRGADLSVGSPVTRVNDAKSSAFNPRTAYAAGPKRFLTVWSEKNQDGSDAVKFSLRNDTLGDLKADVAANNGGNPVVVAGDNDFLVTWQSDKSFGAARVSFDGVVTPTVVLSSGGTAIGSDLVVHDGQPTLIWAESTVDGVRAWINPLCAP